MAVGLHDPACAVIVLALRQCAEIAIVIVITHGVQDDNRRLLPVEQVRAIVDHGTILLDVLPQRVSRNIVIQRIRDNGSNQFLQLAIGKVATARELEGVTVRRRGDGRELANGLAMSLQRSKHFIDNLLFLFVSHVFIILTG